MSLITAILIAEHIIKFMRTSTGQFTTYSLHHQSGYRVQELQCGNLSYRVGLVIHVITAVKVARCNQTQLIQLICM